VPNICPVCQNEYEEVLRGKKATIPPGYDECHKSVVLASGDSIGKWYLHEAGAE